ncbi:MAG: HAD family hydrolase [Crocosphaera sp.]|uniref:D,D-heptose 1,7-bisphosphate phosphatase n=2 Tax=Crocosphaera watsonii TaxID=263511 RepID=T2JYB4_CROWT|nr:MULTISPECIES: HAD family hydrolase [Crocosphaera]MCH2243110.1 HAD family hydrolase [Crocosphaera sp.]NQZ61283.1 HAD family hydrolase [Crocosphaera sp.]CCQ57898.1 D-glycero-D-manno-heptose 1,7-bisphosphate phosphatase [Crocosphaera watsonii WH 0005]CCQ69627.1 D-glycero-D-manno-heptose 1,7-bisphosphate phosphatase [Crocosphaera watsonii WH 0402]
MTTTLTPYTQLQKALFLDRDGVVIKYVPYLSKVEQVELPLGAGEALKRWQDAGYLLIIITNQAGVGRGYYTLEDVEKVHNHIIEEYGKFGVTFTDIFICPHHPQDNCLCRKPAPKMIIDASKKHGVSLSQSLFVGDAPSDVQCAINAECQPVLVLTGRGKETLQNIAQYSRKVEIFDSLQDTVKLIPSP